MSAKLEIRDGDPDWYLSPDIWVVPGTDPTAAAGSPVAGQTAFVWAHVHNVGDADALDAVVEFYWLYPAAHFLRSNATQIGTAKVSLAAGAAQDVLCLVPWIPAPVAGGHECLVAVVSHSADPLPSPAPDDFNPPAYHQIAQKNLTVLPTGSHPAQMVLTVFGLARAEKQATIVAEVGGKLDRLSLERLGLSGYKSAEDAVIEVGLDRRQRCIGDKDSIGASELQLRVERGTSAAIHVSVRGDGLGKDEYQLVRITEHGADAVIGGLGVVVVRDRKEKTR